MGQRGAPVSTSRNPFPRSDAYTLSETGSHDGRDGSFIQERARAMAGLPRRCPFEPTRWRRCFSRREQPHP